jgi:hypothetical protein
MRSFEKILSGKNAQPITVMDFLAAGDLLLRYFTEPEPITCVRPLV